MSANKYATLPDIDTTGPDIYETANNEPQSQTKDGDSSEDEAARAARRRAGDAPSKDELDSSSLLSAHEAGKRFRKAEKRKPRVVYSYPGESDDDVPTSSAPPFTQRLRYLENELALLEKELADPLSTMSRSRKRVDAEEESTGALIKNVGDVRERLEKISKGKQGRDRLVEAIVNGSVEGGSSATAPPGSSHSRPSTPLKSEFNKKDGKDKESASAGGGVAEMDRRLGELERLVGSSTAALDESSPLPPPLLPMLSRLDKQLTILTQPRTIDSISRRLKLLLTDLDELSAHQAGARPGSGPAGSQTAQQASAPSPLQQEITPILQRLAPHLPTLPHIHARLRTLSTLHAAASEFQASVEQLESEQKRNRAGVAELERVIKALEKTLEDNAEVAKRNVEGLEIRIDGLTKRLEAVTAEEQ